MGADTSIGIGELKAARNDPRGDSNDKVSNNQAAARVAVAGALTRGIQRANHIVMDELPVDDVVASTAIHVGDDLSLQNLQIVGHSSLVLMKR